jgi:peptide/nickel transport system substrate-binding protein
MFSEYSQNEFVRVEKFADYWREPAGVDAITFRFIPDATARIQALAAGDVDMIVPVPLDNVAEVEALADVQILISEPVRVRYMAFATKDQAPPYDLLTDDRLRKAINYAIDRESIANDVYGGLATPAISMAYLPSVNDQLEGFAYDPERAQALLTEAGWADSDGDGILDKDGQPLHLVLAAGVPSAQFLAPLPEVVQDQLRDVGIDLEIKEFNDEGSFYDFITEVGEFHMIMEEAGARHDLIGLAYNFYCGCNPEGEAVLYKRLWLTDEFDQTVLDARALPGNALDGDADALAAALRLGEIMVDEFTGGAPLVYTPGIAAAHNYVTNFVLHPRSEFHQDWSGVTIER